MSLRIPIFVILLFSQSTAFAQCVTLKEAARAVVVFVRQDSEPAECLVGVTREEWRLKMMEALRSIKRNQEEPGYIGTLCPAPKNDPNTPEKDWVYGYETSVTISCDGTVQKFIESND